MSRQSASISFTFSQAIHTPVLCSLYPHGGEQEEAIRQQTVLPDRWTIPVLFDQLEGEKEYDVVCMDEEMVAHQLPSYHIFQRYVFPPASTASRLWIMMTTVVAVMLSVGKLMAGVGILVLLLVVIYRNRSSLLSAVKNGLLRGRADSAGEENDPEKHTLLGKKTLSSRAGGDGNNNDDNDASAASISASLAGVGGLNHLSKEAEAVLENLERYSMSKWRCLVCQYLNDAKETACVMCKTPKQGEDDKGERRSRRQKKKTGEKDDRRRGKHSLKEEEEEEEESENYSEEGERSGRTDDFSEDAFANGFEDEKKGDGFGQVAMDIVIGEKEVRQAPPQIVRAGGFGDDEDEYDEYEDEYGEDEKSMSEKTQNAGLVTIELTASSMMLNSKEEEKNIDHSSSVGSPMTKPSMVKSATPVSSVQEKVENDQQSISQPMAISSSSSSSQKAGTTTIVKTTKPIRSTHTEGTTTTTTTTTATPALQAKEAGVTIRQKPTTTTVRSIATKAAPVKIITAGKGMKLTSGLQPRKSAALKKPEVTKHEDLFAELGMNAQ